MNILNKTWLFFRKRFKTINVGECNNCCEFRSIQDAVDAGYKKINLISTNNINYIPKPNHEPQHMPR